MGQRPHVTLTLITNSRLLRRENDNRQDLTTCFIHSDGYIEPIMADAKFHSVKLFTDGACIGNPGPGGWAFILKHPATGKSKESSGGEHNTTNNRMEILAVIAGLEALKSPSNVELFSDSQYVVNSISGWMAKWKSFGWKKSKNSKEPIKNLDLWQRLDGLVQQHTVTARWVRGHAGHAENERCDVLSVAAAALIAKTPAPPTSPQLG